MRTRLSVVLLLAAFVLPYPSEARLPETPKSRQTPAGLNIADWGAIRAEYDRHRRGFFPVENQYHARSYSQQWLATFDGRGFEVKPEGGDWIWGLELSSYGFAGAERVIEGRASTTHDVDHARYKWTSEIEEWFVNKPQGLEHGFTIAQRPAHPTGPLTLHLNVRGGLTAQADGRSASFLDRDGVARMTYSQLQATDARGRDLEARMIAEPNGLRIEVEEASAIYPIRIDPIVQQAYLKASNANGNSEFGCSVAISGDTVIVGAYGEDNNSTGVNGNQSNGYAGDSGAAYVFVRNGTSWSQQAYLKASNTGGAFGWSVAISGDTAIVGAPYEGNNVTGVNGNQSNGYAAASGATYVFVRSGTTWSQQAYLKASNTDANDQFGASVAISGDTAIVGAYLEASKATGVNGNQSDNSAGFFGAGAAYVFVRSSTAWNQQAYLKASNTDIDDQFGLSVAVSGDTAIVGALGEASNATGVNGDQSNNSARGAGAAYVFVRNGAAWSQQAYLKASNRGGSFGGAVAISGETVIVGAGGEASNATGVNGDQSNNSAGGAGAAYVFVRNGAAWSQQAYLKASNTDGGDGFGSRVAISGDTAIVGAPLERSNGTGINGDQSNNSVTQSGAAYLFVRSGAAWSQQAYLKASNSNAFDAFGASVASSGETAVVGAIYQSGNAGAAYVFINTNKFEFLTSISPAAPLRSDSGWVGMHLAVGDAPLQITTLGRYCVAGNSHVHTVKLVSANTKIDVPNATASINMSGCTSGQFVFADLSPSITLSAYAHYYLVSQESNGGDKWLDLAPVTTNPGASVVGSVYFNNLFWLTSGAAGTSYVPLSMKYEIQDPPPSSSAFIYTYNLDNRIQRNNFTGFAGMQLRIGSAPLTVNSVGRGCIPGNSQSHTVKFVNASTGLDVPGASATVNMAGCGTDFVYQALGSPVVLQANTIYYLVSSETAGGDAWTDQSQLATSPDAAVLTSIYSLGSEYAINEANAAYVPPNFLYMK